MSTGRLLIVFSSARKGTRLYCVLRYIEHSLSELSSCCIGSCDASQRDNLVPGVIRVKKQTGTFTNIEENVSIRPYTTFPLVQSLCVLALYYLVISAPYMHLTRHDACALNLGTVLENVETHCRAIEENPDLAVMPNATPETATLCRQPWEHPDTFFRNAVGAELPHLKPTLVALFCGALES